MGTAAALGTLPSRRAAGVASGMSAPRRRRLGPPVTGPALCATSHLVVSTELSGGNELEGNAAVLGGRSGRGCQSGRADVRRGLVDGQGPVASGGISHGQHTQLLGSRQELFSLHLSAPCACLSSSPPDVSSQGNPHLSPGATLGCCGIALPAERVPSVHPRSSDGHFGISCGAATIVHPALPGPLASAAVLCWVRVLC